MANLTNDTGLVDLINAGAGVGQNTEGIAIKAFIVNLATYLVQDRLRVEAIPTNLLKWLQRILTIKDEELKAKCGLDGYFFIRLVRAMILIFVPLMCIIVSILLPLNYHGGRDNRAVEIGGRYVASNVTGLDTLSWQNVAPDKTNRYWAHLVCAMLAISWTLYRIYREKLNFIDVRQRFLTSPEHRLKASARTVLITNIPNEYRKKDALEALFDVFVDNDDRSKLTIWMNRDYGLLKSLAAHRQKLRHTLEKAELRLLRLVNKERQKNQGVASPKREGESTPDQPHTPAYDTPKDSELDSLSIISAAFDNDSARETELWRKYLKPSKAGRISLVQDKNRGWKPVSMIKFWSRGERTVPKIAWLRSEIARLTVKIDELLEDLDDDARFKQQNSAFVQFDRQMAAHMACSLVSHQKPGRMSPRYLEVAPHEVLWQNMGLTSRGRLIRICFALLLFATILFLWGLPVTFLGFLSQLGSLRSSTKWLHWLRHWPSWIISIISGPLNSILLALFIQLVVPALLRKLAVLVGTPTRTRRELVTQGFYFTFLFFELVLVTSISSGVVTIIPTIIANPVNIPTILATNLPKAANYFFNYLIIQALGWGGSVLFQYLRVLYITTIWPWFTQTPRQEAWLQTTIPHQMWANVYSLNTNYAVIGLIYCVISPLMLVFVSMVFALFWVAYRHNYYYVQRNKIDTHGLLFNNAISQLFTGIYVLEVLLIGLFFLVRDSRNNAACKSQAIIMIVILILTAIFHIVMESHLRPLYEFLPVSLEDSAVEAEQRLALLHESNATSPTTLAPGPETSDSNRLATPRSETMSDVVTAANARSTLSLLKTQITARISKFQARLPESIYKSRRRQLADQIAASIAGYPDELSDLTPEEREAELKAAFQDPVTREPAPVIWLPQDEAGCSDDAIKQVQGYGRLLQYSNAGAYLTRTGKCEVVQPAPD
ncbi:MAG: hypothetical protein Q9191_002508, partial [Dirinaria sp. TL-2023a]